MPRKTSQSTKKETPVIDSKNEGGAPRRSGRGATKESATGKEAARSRRSSTAAQTAASVADSKTPKGRSSVSSQRESTSPSESRNKNSKEGLESPATRVKSTRRNTGHVNYKESDGEEEVPTPKYDDNFDSNEEFEDSDSDEKTKIKGRNRSTKAASKGHGSKDKAKGARSRRGRPMKKKNEDEDSDACEISDEDSLEPENSSSNKKSKVTPTKEKEKEIPKSGRTRRAKAETSTKLKPATEEKAKPSRRSSRSVSNKEEPPKKRPSRSLQAKRYTEEDEDEDIEEVTESKAEEEDYAKPEVESSRKRKRAAASDANKRMKETVEEANVHDDAESVDNEGEETPELKVDLQSEGKPDKDETAEESMEVDEVDSPAAPENGDKSVVVENEGKNVKSEVEASEELVEDRKDAQEGNVFAPAKSADDSSKQESIDSCENFDESMHSSDSEQESRAEQSISSGLEDSQDSKDIKEQNITDQKFSAEEKVKEQEIDLASQSSESFQQMDENSEEPKGFQPAAVSAEQKSDSDPDQTESNVDYKTRSGEEGYSNDTFSSQENKIVSDSNQSLPNASIENSPVTHSKEPNSDASVNGSEESLVTSSAPIIHSTSSVIFDHPENPTAPKANGAHDDLHNSDSSNDQYFLIPGRKYVINTKLNDSIRQSVKGQTFGFVSYNLASSNSDGNVQKEKLLNELNSLDAHILCIQQISKSYYSSVLEPSLDVLGFKGVFSQSEESSKGVATFYKSTLFRLSGQSEVSLKQLIEKEIETSSLDANDRIAVRAHVNRCGHVLFTHFASVVGTQIITVANVQIPPTDINIHALQVSCLAREIIRVDGGTNKPLLLGGEFSMLDSDASYQLLRDGYLSNDMIEALQARKDVVLPGKENAALVNLLWKSFQHPSSNLCSCYASVLDHEIFIPGQRMTSPDLLWYSSDSLYAVGILDIISEKPGDHHFPLKADMAFSV